VLAIIITTVCIIFNLICEIVESAKYFYLKNKMVSVYYTIILLLGYYSELVGLICMVMASMWPST